MLMIYCGQVLVKANWSENKKCENKKCVTKPVVKCSLVSADLLQDFKDFHSDFCSRGGS